MMKRLHRPLITTLLAVALLVPTAKPAHADILGDAVKFIVAPLVALFAGGSALMEHVMLAIEAELPMMIATMEMKADQKMAEAAAEATRNAYKQGTSVDIDHEYQMDFLQANCMAQTGLRDTQLLQTTTAARSQSYITNDFSTIRNRGSKIGTYRPGRAPLSNDPVVQKVQEFHDNLTYASENEADAAVKSGVFKSVDEVKKNPYKLANVQAATLVNTHSFAEDKHFVAAMDYCYATTGNQLANYAEGRALTENVENMQQFLQTLSAAATQSLSSMECLAMVYRKMPVNTTFAQNHPEYKRTLEDMVGSGDDATGDGKRTLEDVDKRTRAILLDPTGGGYVEVAAKDAVLGEMKPGERKQLVKGQMVSFEEHDMAEYLYRWSSTDYIKTKGSTTNLRMQQLVQTKAANLELMWRQYAQLERQVLYESVMLAREVSAVKGNPDSVVGE